MKTVRFTLKALTGMIVVIGVVGTSYVLAEERHSANQGATAADVHKIKVGMPFNQVVSTLGPPQNRNVVKDEGGTDPGLFRATWKSSNGPVTIDFNAFVVTRIEGVDNRHSGAQSASSAMGTANKPAGTTKDLKEIHAAIKAHSDQ